MSAHNFWDNFSHGFMHGMFNSNPFLGCWGGGFGFGASFGFGNFSIWGGFGFNSFNNCYSPFQLSNPFMYPSMGMNFMPIMPSYSPMGVDFSSMNLNLQDFFKPTWDDVLQNQYWQGNLDLFVKSENKTPKTIAGQSLRDSERENSVVTNPPKSNSKQLERVKEKPELVSKSRGNSVNVEAVTQVALSSGQASRVSASKNKTLADFYKALGIRESGGDYKAKNSLGYVGKYQMGEMVLVDCGYYKKKSKNYNNDWSGTFTGKDGINSLEDFLNNPSVQEKAQVELRRLQWRYLKNVGADKYIGQVINGYEITASGLLAGAHLAGAGGVINYLKSNGKNNFTDANGTSVESYMKNLAHYDVSTITGLPHTTLTA